MILKNIGGIGLLLVVGGIIGCQTSSERPNILIILADDLGYSDIGAYGGEIHTPTLDTLAENGVRFRQFYNAGRCCPTRASLLTGRYPHGVGMGAMVSSVDSELTTGPYQGYLSESALTLAEMLQDAGYHTYMSGKWHVGERPQHWPRTRGFERYFGLISGASSYYEIIENQPRKRQMVLDDDPWSPPDSGFYMTDAFTDRAIEFLQSHPSEKPFLLYLAYTAPHWPLHALPEDIARYTNEYEDGWDVLRQDRYTRMQELGVIDETYAFSSRPARLPAWQDMIDRKDWALRMSVYAAMVDRMDQGIGRVIDQLRSMDALDNTLVIFLSDNGGCAESVDGRRLHDPSTHAGERGSYLAYEEAWANASNTPFRLYKQWVHEGGIATPLIAHWPARIRGPGRIIDEPGHVIDLMATVAEVARATLPHSDGKSLLPLLDTPEYSWPDRTLYWEHIGNRAIRQGDWKLVWDRGRAEWELYNLALDATELYDLAAEAPEIASSLQHRWEVWADSIGVQLR
ncbi:MAG: arylsulfatase [Bacteroidetes bacterium]|nr:arylsulfatase [Bacteroidota bacterium]